MTFSTNVLNFCMQFAHTVIAYEASISSLFISFPATQMTSTNLRRRTSRVFGSYCETTWGTEKYRVKNCVSSETNDKKKIKQFW